jgi:UDP-N-acetylmuramoyl-tripeptide--D-alanyl-D-alanine ligase
MSDMNLSLKQINPWLTGAQLHGDADLSIQRVNTDSRTCQAGDLFVALQGERFDANNFLFRDRPIGGV